MAASYQIPAVKKFDFVKPEERSRWIQRFERFRQASDLTSKSEEAQISTLVYSLGDKTEDILTSFNLKDEELKKYDTVKGKFDSYFAKRRNTIYKRARLNSRTQGENETGRVYRRSLVSWKTVDMELCTMNWYEIESSLVSGTANCQRSFSYKPTSP